MTMITLLATAAAAPVLAQKAYDEGPDVTGLRARGEIALKPRPGNPDVMAIEVGNGYFNCGGALGSWQGGLGLKVLRKGAKAACDSGPLVLAVTTTRKNGSTISIETAIDVQVPRQHALVMFACGKTADVAVAKIEDKPQLTRIAAAWKYTDGVLTPVADTKKVRCENEGYGA